MLIYYNYVFYLHSFISHTQLKPENVKRKWMRHRQIGQPLPPLKMKIFWPPPKIQNFQIPTSKILGGVRTMKDQLNRE